MKTFNSREEAHAAMEALGATVSTETPDGKPFDYAWFWDIPVAVLILWTQNNDEAVWAPLGQSMQTRLGRIGDKERSKKPLDI